jgi:hypothetical protein
MPGVTLEKSLADSSDSEAMLFSAVAASMKQRK